MYRQGNYSSQFGHSLQAPLPPFQEGPPGPPPPFQQGPPAPPPRLVQSAPSPPMYLPPPPIQHVGPPRPPLLQQGPPIQIPPTGLANDSYSYLNPPLPVHGSSRMLASSYSTVEQNSQYLSFRTTQNVYHMPPPAPPLPAPPLTSQSHTEMMRAPAPPRVLPPPPSQGKMFYRVPPHPSPPGSAQGLQHVGPTPPPPRFGSLPVAPAPFTSFLYAPVEVAHPPSISPPPPPPLPSSPLPLPPSPPLPASPPPPPPPLNLSSRSSLNLSDMLLDAVSNMPPESESYFHSVKLSDSAERIIDSIDKVVGPTLTMVDVPEHDDQLDGEDENICQMGSVIEDTFSYKTQALLDLSLPLHKPEERIIRKIEVLCQFIAKNGPDFEHMAREKESRNPEFAFLFGGESGSGAAIAHEYFQWMKRKCQLEAKICNKSVQSDTSPGSCQKMESSTSPNKLIDENESFSPADSDIDMEDDGNQSSSDQGIDLSIETLNMEPVSMCDEIVNVKEQLHAPQCLTECPTSSDTLSGSISCFGSSGLAKQEKEHDHSISTKDHGPVMNAPGAAELMLDSSVNKSMGPLLEDLSPFGASSAVACVSQKGLPGLLVKGESPFRLVQDYDSDDNAEDNDESQLEDVSPVRVSHLVSVSNKGLHGDTVIDLDANPSSKNVSSTEKEVASFIESVALCPTSMLDVSLEPHEMVEATVLASEQLNAIAKTDELGIGNFGNQTSDNQVTSLDPFRPKDVLQGDQVDTAPQNRSFPEETKQASISLEVDKFGRLIREGANDSDSDGPRFTVRHRKRGRSWSRSRSHQDKRRSRSPSRRKEKRSRSRSWSPKRNRGRSRSPLTFKRMGEKTRWDRGQIPDCFDFLRGRCYRGASCRYLHHDSATEFEPRHYRSKQPQNVEGRSDLRNPLMHGEIKNIPTEMSDGEHDEVENLEIQPFQDSSVSCTDAAKYGCLVEKTEMPSVKDEVQPFISNGVGGSPVTVVGEVGQSESSEGTTVQLQEKMEVQQVPEKPTVCLLENENVQLRVETSQPLPVDCASTQPATNAEIQKFSGETPLDEPLSGEFSDIQPPQAGDLVPLALPMLETTSHHPQKKDSSSISHSLSIQTSSSFPNMLPMSEPIPNKIPSSQAYPNSTSMSQPYPSESCAPQTMAPKEFHSSSFLPEDFQFHHSQLPAPPPLPKNINAPLESQPPKDYNFAPVAGTFQSQYAPVEGLPPCEAPLHGSHSHFPASPKPSWNSFPPPPSYVTELVPSSAMHTPRFPPLQFQPSPMPPTNDFSQPLGRPCPPEAPTDSQVIGFHHRTFPPREEAHRPPLHVDNPWDQQFGSLSFIRDERSAMPESNQFRSEPWQDYHLYSSPQIGEHRLPLPIQDGVRNFPSLQNQRFTSQFAVQGFTSSSLFTQENMHSQPIPFPRESPAMQSQMKFPGDNLPPRTFSREDFVASARNRSYSQQPDLSCGLQHSATDSFSSHMGALSKADSSISRYPSSFLDSNQSFRLPDVGGSIVANSTHYNPFASTFEQPSGSSKFNFSAFKREIDANYTSKKYDFPFGLSHASVEGQGISGIGSRQTASPSDSNKSGGHRLPRSGGSLQTQSQYVREATADDQYDPLFDSIEPSSNALGKFDTIENQDTTTDVINRSVVARANVSEIMLRHSGSHRPLDLEVHNKQKRGGITVVTNSPDEFGETLIDIELGAVKNGSPQPVDGISWSPVNLVDQANAIIGEMESDQVQTQGKGKKSKDSRSMKLFKIALADFVKEVLKPSWRQGNMSKEAFKTIVKKTVDKVSGAMKGHQIPKTRAKINQYIESSQRKLTKLVMGYVDKYVKV